ncbi:unnamed protein product, partial [Phaeothamnion confervicola]
RCNARGSGRRRRRERRRRRRERRRRPCCRWQHRHLPLLGRHSGADAGRGTGGGGRDSGAPDDWGDAPARSSGGGGGGRNALNAIRAPGARSGGAAVEGGRCSAAGARDERLLRAAVSRRGKSSMCRWRWRLQRRGG